MGTGRRALDAGLAAGGDQHHRVAGSEVFAGIGLDDGAALAVPQLQQDFDRILARRAALDGVVLSLRPVIVDGSQSGIGAVAGGVAGGVAGASVGGRRESVVVGVIGAVVGSVVGNAVERAGTREDAVEVLVQLRNGERRAIVQAKAGETLYVGDAVVIITTGSRVRVTRAPMPSPTPIAPGPKTS